MLHELIRLIKFTATTVSLITSACALLVGGSSLSAATVQYTTTGIFSNTGNETETSSGVTLTYMSASGLVDANPASFVGFGNVVVTTPDRSEVPVSLPDGLGLTIQIAQMQPTSGTGELSGSLSGSLTGNSSSAIFIPSSTTLTIDGITYAFTQNFYALIPPSSRRGNTSIQGMITASVAAPTPEPASMALLASGFLAIGIASRKKFLMDCSLASFR